MAAAVITYDRAMGRWEPDARGRLERAALELFSERGFEQATAAEIAARAGLAERTFFRYFADKREVLFGGSGRFQEFFTQHVAEAPAQLGPLDAVIVAVEAVGVGFDQRRELSRQRQNVIVANAELRERELIKLATLAVALAEVLRRRGVGDPAADLAAEAGVAVFRIAFQNWVDPTNDRDFGELVRESVAELRSVTVGGQPAAGRAFAAATEA
jgi:AcrR family transcriptional regulator